MEEPSSITFWNGTSTKIKHLIFNRIEYTPGG
ncbi:hypothetical protein IG9_01397 [Bacillus cereus HuA2-9]|nr:hypothetical protein IG9_01397 [Bacillus cereus HuA2-9]